jgi:tripartite-type tricarboxylate transporter receptor subunit TctC
MRKILVAILIVFVSSLACMSHSVFAQANFYEGKAIRFIVGFTAGGGYDAYTRMISRHMGKHISGNPSMIVENMPGAGSMISANYTFKAARPDGLTIGHFIGGLFLQQLLGKPGHRVRCGQISVHRRSGPG